MWSEERAGRVSAFKDESTEVQVGSRRTTEKISKAKNSFLRRSMMLIAL